MGEVVQLRRPLSGAQSVPGVVDKPASPPPVLAKATFKSGLVARRDWIMTMHEGGWMQTFDHAANVRTWRPTKAFEQASSVDTWERDAKIPVGAQLWCFSKK